MADLGIYAGKFDELGIPRETAERYAELFNGKIFVVKGGGEVVAGGGTVAYDLAAMHKLGIKTVLFHGGKKWIEQRLGEQGLKSVFVGGYRVTRPGMMKPIEDALDEVNYELCKGIEYFGVRATSLKCVTYARKHERVYGRDLGLVGEPTRLSIEREDLISQAGGSVLVVSPISLADPEFPTDYGGNIETLNTNADDAAGFVASEMGAERLLYLTDRDGVIISGSRVSELSEAGAEGYIRSRHINKGMTPKVRRAIKARAGGVQAVHIINGGTEHALLREIYSDEGIGTMIV